MIKSMTGFGRVAEAVQSLSISVEMKAVNHKYFEFSVRAPKAFARLEDSLRTLCRQKIARGKVEVFISIEDTAESSAAVEINRPVAEAYVKALKAASKELGVKNDITVSSLLSLPELFRLKKTELPEETVAEAVTKATSNALDAFCEMRRTEGEKLAKDISSRVACILEMVARIEERSPETVRDYRARLEQRIRELLEDVSVDEQRLLTESAIFADKIAVAEETVRLRSHISQLTALLGSEEAVGRKLDFLVQEMNRETNTIGSKAQDIEIAHIVVDIKSEIEKIREQVQNIE